MLKKIVLGAIIASASTASLAATSISGSTDFRVTVPEILVLYHWDDAHLILTDVTTTPENDSDVREISDATTRTKTVALGGTYAIDGDVVTSSLATSPLNATIDVTLKNSWAVRSISSDKVTLALTNPNTELKNTTDNSVTISTSDAKLSSTAANVTGSDTASMTLPSKWEPTMGDIKFKLDLSKATKSGEYNTRGVAGAATTGDEATDTFLLTLTGN